MIRRITIDVAENGYMVEFEHAADPEGYTQFHRLKSGSLRVIPDLFSLLAHITKLLEKDDEASPCIYSHDEARRLWGESEALRMKANGTDTPVFGHLRSSAGYASLDRSGGILEFCRPKREWFGGSEPKEQPLPLDSPVEQPKNTPT